MNFLKITGTILLLNIGILSYGQQGMWNPFTLIVVQPDTAVVDQSLYNYGDSIVATEIGRYFSFLARMEEVASCKSCDSSFKEDVKKRLPGIKAYETEVRKFKYYQLVSSYSSEVYNFYFNEYAPFSAIHEVPWHSTGLADLRHLADSVKADYIVFFSAIHTLPEEQNEIIELTTSLYARKEDKIIFAAITRGDTLSKGDMWTCGNPLSCMLINGIKTSTDAVAPILRQRQKRS